MPPRVRSPTPRVVAALPGPKDWVRARTRDGTTGDARVSVRTADPDRSPIRSSAAREIRAMRRQRLAAVTQREGRRDELGGIAGGSAGLTRGPRSDADPGVARRPVRVRARTQSFGPGDASTIAAWVTSPQEACRWASMLALPDAATFERWHDDPDVLPFVVRDDRRLVAYGEIRTDREADEAELARLLVAPDARGNGIGRWLARALADEAHGRGFADVWLRVSRTTPLRCAPTWRPASCRRRPRRSERSMSASRWRTDGCTTGRQTARDVTGSQGRHT